MPPTPIASPAGYATANAMAYADGDGNVAIVSGQQPLPVQKKFAATAPLAGLTSVTGVFGPFAPALDRSVMLTLSGTWAGTVKVVRSIDGGATRLPLTVAGSVWAQFTGNACEPVWDESESAATLYLDVTLTSGTLVYRLAQ
ncbi:hypothetical protein [Novosphingobium percolationis]|uniref:hypothetical protein n=1 Tax=Novosphingobium percolationis TaxID=2871811 RepID=UPI001CD4288B|nr:hypothetical protein [Novosphingobium percolationis]